MAKIIILSGISNAGKSSFASELVQKHPQAFVVVNRDKLREAHYGYTEETVKHYYTHKDFNYMESQITAVQDKLIDFWLRRNKDVIIDATNLKNSYIKEFSKFGVPTEVKFFDITLEEALIRDSNRKRQVGKEIIERQYAQYLNLKEIFLV